jgi:hypothetical protein
MYNIHIFRDLQSEPILTVELHRRFLYYSFFFFQEKTLSDISFKLETKIMNFMTLFFFLKKNIIRTT